MLHFACVITDFLSWIQRIKTYFLEPNISMKILFGEYSETLRRYEYRVVFLFCIINANSVLLPTKIYPIDVNC